MRFVLLAIALAIIGAAIAEEGSDVITLDADNFDQELAANSLLLVEFYAPWCGHCKHLAPEYEKAATAMKEQGVNARIAKIDADDAKNTGIRDRFQISGFPTLKLFRDGQVQSDFNGERSAAGIASYMKKQSSPASTKLTTAADATSFKDAEKAVIVGFFDNEESEAYKTFVKVASALREKFSFGEVVGASDINTALEVTKVPSVVVFKKFDELKNVLEEITTEEALTEFVENSGTPLIDEIGPLNFRKYVETTVPLLYLFVDLTVDGQLDANLPHVKELAQSTKGRLNFVYIDSAKYGKHSERLGLTGNVIPCIAIENVVDGTHYVFDESATITKEGVTQWVNDFLDGKIAPTIKSEPIPEDNNGPVKVLVANNFNEIVNDATKDVLVEFYAPWCGHCKKLTPIYEELGTALRESHPNVVIAKIDATANDVNPKFGIRGFPTLKFFPANDKETPIDYEGDRSLADMQSFVEKNAVAAGATGAAKDEL